MILILGWATGLHAATYLPVSDAELVTRSEVIVRGTVLDQAVRLETIKGKDLPFTITSVKVLEVIKGRISERTVRVRLPGGKVGDLAWWVPGTPTFQANEEVILLLNPASGRPGEYHLSEFGMGQFDVMEDESGHRFAVRPAFEPEEDLYLSRQVAAVAERVSDAKQTVLRDAGSFLEALRAWASGNTASDVHYAAPEGATASPSDGLKPEWVNIGGSEPGNCKGAIPCLFRWFWDTGFSPNAVVTVNGTQSNLTDGSNGLAHTQNGIDQWHSGVPATDVRISGISSSGNVTVDLDAVSSFDGGASWSTPLGCPGTGIIGLGGPTPSQPAGSFKGDTYYGIPGGTVSIRKNICSSGFDAATFREDVMHELGHVLGLGHPDQAQSVHSSTSSSDWFNAVMTSSVPPGKPSTPQTDDVQAMQYYYGTNGGGGGPVANFSFSPSNPQPGQAVSFKDISTGSPTPWSWNFGDGGTSIQQNPAHSFAQAGQYSVSLTVTNSTGPSTISKSIQVGSGSSATITEFSTFTPQGSPSAIISGPGGALWFILNSRTSITDGHIVQMATNGDFQQIGIGTSFNDIAAGPDGALWLTEIQVVPPFGGRIWRVTTTGAATVFALPNGGQPAGITSGPDGALWFTEQAGNKIGRISTSGGVTEFTIPTPNSYPFGITAGPDSALWYTVGSSTGVGRIGRITTSGSITEFPLPGALSLPLGITAGPDGALWFTDDFGKIGRITTSGGITEFTVPTANSGPSGITTGPDGALWFTEFYGNKIGRLVPGGGNGSCASNATTLCLNGGRFRVGVTWTKRDGSTGAGQAVPLTSDTGHFWFFSANNVEVVVKVVDGRAVDNHFWVFAGGLTDVNVVLTITDMATGAVKTYTNPQGVPFAPIQDTSAFAGASVPHGAASPAGLSKAAMTNAAAVDLSHLIERAANAVGPFTVRLFNPDNRLTASLVNRDGSLTQIGFVDYQQDHTFDFTSLVQPGTNVLRISLENFGGGWTYGYEFRQGSQLLASDSCGTAGTNGCNNNDMRTGIVFTRDIPFDGGTGCATTTTLCLNAGRFKVGATWKTSDGRSGAGQAVSLTGDTGYFWFFSANNVEAVVKVVDGRAVNNHFWVFAGGLTDVSVVLTVIDTVTGAVKTYTNPQGTPFAPIQDTSAFPGP